jgi:hypothetical protein
MTEVGRVVWPGDRIAPDGGGGGGGDAGQGVRIDAGDAVATRSGVLRQTGDLLRVGRVWFIVFFEKTNTTLLIVFIPFKFFFSLVHVVPTPPLCRLWVDADTRRYVPTTGDTVVGIVSSRGGETYSVDIGGARDGRLGNLEFEGATRKNRPNLVRYVVADRVKSCLLVFFLFILLYINII